MATNRPTDEKITEIDEKIAMLTGNAIQDDETFKYEGGFIPERDQLYFELKQGENTFLIGFTDILLCLKILEQLDEIPKIPSIWWQQAQSLYGGKANMLELNILEKRGSNKIKDERN